MKINYSGNLNKFKNPLKLELTDKQSDGRPVYKLLEPVEFEIAGKGHTLYVYIPKDFMTDFASVPRLLWGLFPPIDTYSKAAVIHDFLYSKNSAFTRKLADNIFYEIMKILGVPFWKRYTMLVAVRLFGWISFQGKSR